MFKFYSLLIGENPEYTKTFQPASKRKIILYANCLMIPVILWFINSYLLVSHVLKGGFIPAIITAFLAGFIIFLIERSILMSNGGKAIYAFRILLGFIIASLGSISMDEVIFKNDIDNQVATYRQTEIENATKKIESDFLSQISIQQSIVHQKDSEWKSSLNEAKKEADGTGGSRQKLVGKIALLKMNVASKLESDYNTENQKLKLINDNLVAAIIIAKEKAEADFNGNALLMRIRALFELISKDIFMLIIYILVTLFLFSLEFLVVIIKAGSKASIDEDLENAREALLRAKTKKTLDRSYKFFNPETMIPSVMDANLAINRKPSSIFN